MNYNNRGVGSPGGSGLGSNPGLKLETKLPGYLNRPVYFMASKV